MPTEKQKDYWRLQWRIGKLEEKLDKLYVAQDSTEDK